MLLLRYLVYVRTWVRHEGQNAVVGASSKFAVAWAPTVLELLPFAASWAWLQSLMLLTSLSLKLLAVVGGKQITSGVVQKDRPTVVLSRPAVRASLVTKPLSLPVHAEAAEMLRREKFEQPDPVNRLVDVDKYSLVVSPELDPAN